MLQNFIKATIEELDYPQPISEYSVRNTSTKGLKHPPVPHVPTEPH